MLLGRALPRELLTELLKQIQEHMDDAKLIVLVSTDAERALLDSIEAGAAGCIPEEASLDELRTAIEMVSLGKKYCSPRIAGTMFTQLSDLARASRWNERIESSNLTSREIEVLQLIADEKLSNKQIAHKLTLSLYTVKNHVHNILEKLPVQDRFAAAEYAHQQRWF